MVYLLKKIQICNGQLIDRFRDKYTRQVGKFIIVNAIKDQGTDSWSKACEIRRNRPRSLHKTSLKTSDRNLIQINFGIVLYSFLNLIVGPLSVYVCALNRTFLLVG